MIDITVKDQHGNIARQFALPSSLAEMTVADFVGLTVEREMGAARGESDFVVWCRVFAWLLNIPETEIQQYSADVVGKMWMHMANVIGGYVPKVYNADDTQRHITIDGEIFVIPTGLRPDEAPVTVLEHLCVSEAQIVAEQIYTAQQAIYTESATTESLVAATNAIATKYATLLAVLLRKPGETLPLDAMQRHDFINERAALMMKAPATVALDVAFFLSETKTGYKRIQETLGSLIHHLLSIILEVRSMRAPKQTRRQRRQIIRAKSRKESALGG